MPVTRLFGVSAAGLNATGAGDARNWYDAVGDYQTKSVLPGLRAVPAYPVPGESWTDQGHRAGQLDSELPATLAADRQERATTRKTVAETDAIYYDMGVVTSSGHLGLRATNTALAPSSVWDTGDPTTTIQSETVIEPPHRRTALPNQRETVPNATPAPSARQKTGPNCGGYRRALRPVLKPLLDVLADLTRDLEREWPQPQPVRTDADRDIGRLIARSADQFAKAIRAQSVTPIASKYAQATSEFQRAQLAKQAKAAVGIDIRKLTGLDRDIPRRLAAFSEENAQLITGLGARLADDVAKGRARRRSHWIAVETIAARLAERELVTESRAALIARDQVGKLFGEVNKARQQNIGVSGYVWRTANDNRVREEHGRWTAIDSSGAAHHQKGIPESRQLPLLRRPGLLGTARLTKCHKT